MSSQGLGDVEEIASHATITGKLIPESIEDHSKLVRLARAYAHAVRKSLNLVWRGYTCEEATKHLYNILPNYIYLETAYKNAEAIAENIRFYEEENGGERILADIHRFWISSRGNRSDRGNRNIRLVPREGFFEALVRYPWNGSWIRARAFFGEKYIPLLRELIDLCDRREEGYGAVISFRDYPRIHIQTPLWLYLKHLSKTKPRGCGLVAGLDINSDRVNAVIIDRGGSIVAMKSFWYGEATSHGYPREKAEQTRINTLVKILEWCGKLGADYVVFEDLTGIKRKRFTESPYANRKIAKFPKKQLLMHGVIRAMRLGFTVIMVNPSGTSSSKTHRQIVRERGLDRHMASAYIIAYRGLKRSLEIKNLRSKAGDRSSLPKVGWEGYVEK